MKEVHYDKADRRSKMNGKKYLVYLDILGFEDLAREIAKKTGFEEDVIRQNYLSDPLEKKIEEIKRKEIQISKGISEIEGSDNYVLIVDHIQTAFELVGKLTTIKILHKEYEFIPLEVGLGAKKIDEDIEVKPINRKEIIKFLKNDIINPYRGYYKKKHGDKIKETFVLFTRDFFDELEPLDKKYCEEISYKKKNFFVANLNKVQQRGRVFEFLEKIGYAGSKWYGRINEVYVLPLEYEDMVRTLKEKRIVFITGTQEYGKTYTAVKLMWEYYNSGYEPGWIKGGEPAERIEVRKKLENIRAELKPRHIIYFEDPFGKTKYERREGLEREIGTIIDSVKQVEDAYVIITSREEVFKEFEKEKLSAKELKEFEKKLNIKRSSYDYEKRKEILLNWAEEEDCKWLENKKLKKLVLESLKNEKSLPTPLSIKDFAVATSNIEKKDELKEKIKEKSKETAKAFAEEIRNMTDDKILSLSFLFISDYFKVEFVRTTYQELVKELNLEDAWEFNRILDWFKDDKIDSSGNHIEFSHPSYSEALEYLLVEDGYITQINERIFGKLLFKLSEKDKAVGYVARAVAANFGKLPEDVRNKLLLKLSEKDKAAWAVARAVADNFDKLPENVRNKLLFKHSEKDEAAGVVARTVARNFNKLPEDVRNLLFKLSEKDETAWAVARAVAHYFDKLPEDVRNLLFKLSEKDEAAGAVARAVAHYFDKLPEDVRNKLLLKLLEKDKAARAVAKAVAYNFDKLPEDVRNLLFQLSEKDKAARAVAGAVAYNFDKLPESVRNELLFKLSEKDKAARAVAGTVAYNFDKLPEDVRNLLGGLQKPLQQVIERLSRSKERLQALQLISNALPKINQDFVLKILNELSKCEDETVRIKAQKMLKDIFDDSEGKKEC
jgi:Mg/Co/Ni transporter MgtE